MSNINNPQEFFKTGISDTTSPYNMLLRSSSAGAEAISISEGLHYADPTKKTFPSSYMQRIWNITLALLGLIISLPIFPVIAFFIKMNSAGPVFYKQKRVGENEEEFLILKFRTMYADAESKTGAVWAQKNDPRVTKVGRILRKSRLDELPQLINVLKGDMNFIGPRPERPEFVNKLKQTIPYYTERHSVKPGITGWAQVKYPYGASIKDAKNKLKYDLFYIKNNSFSFDLAIITKTIQVVLFGQGAR